MNTQAANQVILGGVDYSGIPGRELTRVISPTWCQFTWRLPGERREVQCRLMHNHGGRFHRVGTFVTPVDR
jgi:hypothetical protein